LITLQNHVTFSGFLIFEFLSNSEKKTLRFFTPNSKANSAPKKKKKKKKKKKNYK